MAGSATTTVESLYIHVPFCVQKCAYCAFYSEPSSGDLINRYVAALIRELELVAHDLQPRTIFFGGGTPSLLNLRQWEQILRVLERLNLLGAEEFTVECNPATVSPDKAKRLRDFGVNRISMGVQSLDEPLLERLGRIHTREMVFKSFDILRRAGFDNLNLDLMFAIPGQTMEVWRATLAEVLAFGSEHLSTYEVIYEDDTPLFAQLQAGEFDVDEDLACAMYEELVERATGAGFRQYEVANFARDRRAEKNEHPTFNIQHSTSNEGEQGDSSPAVQQSNNPTIHPPPRLQTQRQLLARRFVLRAGPQRDQLRTRRADEELVEYAALLRAVGKGKAGHRIPRGIAAIETCGRNRRVRFADECGLAVCGIPARDRFRFARRVGGGDESIGGTRLGRNSAGQFSSHATGIAFCRFRSRIISALT